MPRDYAGAEKRPKPRTIAEVNAILAGAPEPAPQDAADSRGAGGGGQGSRPRRARLPRVAQSRGANFSRPATQIEVVTAMEWPAKEEFQKADAMIFYQHGDWNANRAADIDAFLERGGGLVYVHWAVDGGKGAKDFAERIGLASGPPGIKFRHGPLELDFKNAKHPIARNFDKLKLVDESYWLLTGTLPKDRVLGWATEEKEAAAALLVAGTRQRSRVRVDSGPLFVDIRRSAFPRAFAARHRLEREGAGRSLQRSGLARRGRGEVNAGHQAIRIAPGDRPAIVRWSSTLHDAIGRVVRRVE